MTPFTDPLTDDEIRLLNKIAEQFPDEQQVYEAAHRENVWKEAEMMGALIPYSCAHNLTAI
jgi:ferredoxin